MKISVIMPVYNGEKTVRKSIDSVLCQEGAQIELIVVNDGSADSTENILAEYGDRIKAFNKSNGGVADARNVALSHATGDYLMFVDGDDALEADAIKLISEKIADASADIVRFEYSIVRSDGRRLSARDRFENEEFITKELFTEKIYPLFVNGIRLNSMCTLAVKRSLFEGLSFRTDMKTGEDAYLLTDIYTRAENVLVLPKELYLYNVNEGSLTGSGLSVIKKYICNFKLSGKIASCLPLWKMNTPKWYIKTYLRPVKLTFDKLRRINDMK